MVKVTLCPVDRDKKYLDDFVTMFGRAANLRKISYFQNVILKDLHPSRLRWFLELEPVPNKSLFSYEYDNVGAVRALYSISKREGELKRPAEELLQAFFEVDDYLRNDGGMRIRQIRYEQSKQGYETYKEE